MKKTFLLAIVIFSFNASTTIATDVPSGSVSGTWTSAGSPYNIQGSIQIPNDSTLTIEPGVIVNFQGAYKLNVQGRLLAIGTITDTITFIASDNSAGIRGIRFYNTPVTNDSSKFLYCKFKYGTSDDVLYFYNFSKAIISKCNISNCWGYGLSGGVGIYCYNSSPIISYNLISNNSSTGIWADGGCNSIIAYNNISNNSGSGIRCAGCHPIISNNIISNNSGVEGGGIFCNYYSTPTIINNVIMNNSATYGGGICFHNTNPNINPNLYNTIIWGNTASSGGSQVYLGDEENDPNFYYCDVQGGSAAFDINGNTYTGAYQNNINTDPLVVAPSGGSGVGYNGVIADWSLQNSSPCIDAGNPFDTIQLYKYPATDMAGNPRVNVCRIDIGAYEYQIGISSFTLTLSISQSILCNGAATGEITAAVSGGTLPYTYLWSNGQTTSNATGLIAGNYSVTVSTASYGCTLTKSIAIKEPTPISVEAGIDQTVICGGTVQLDAQPKWVALNSSATNQLNSVFFIAEDTGCIVGVENYILKTANAGAEWESIFSSNARSVYFTNANIGYTVGDYGVIGTTIDGGYNWNCTQPLGNSYGLYSVYFPVPDTGYIVGSIGRILKTIDGGANWTIQTSGTTYHLNSVYFTDANHGIAVGNSGTILKTSDGGTNWSVQTIGSVTFFNSVYFTDTNTGYAVGAGNTGGAILKTINGGISWIALTSGTPMALFSVCFPDSITGYVAGINGTILKTSNGGTSWTALTSGTTYDLRSIYFPNTNTGYAVGNNGTILKLTENVSYAWSPAADLNNDSIQSPTATVAANTKYYVTITTPNGCTATDSVTVFVNSLTANAGMDKTIICGGTAQLDNVTSNYTGTGTLTYSWLPITGLNNSNIANPVATVNSNQTYTVTVSTPNGCVATDDVNVTIIPMNAPEICIVGVDSTNKNLIVWNKPLSLAIDSFYIYRETNITNVYQKIGTVSYDSLSVFVDTNSFPDVQSNKYKISIFDDCWFESAQSDYHKTMHLAINQGMGNVWNLIWDPYEGFTVSTYKIYRGTAPDNLQLIGTTSGGNTQYSDLSAPTGYVYYQVEVISPNFCNPSKSYNSSRSNIATNNGSGIDENINASDLFLIYPNPAYDRIEIESPQNANIKIFTSQGQIIEIINTTNKKTTVDVSNLSCGIYIIKAKTDKEITIRKFIKR